MGSDAKNLMSDGNVQIVKTGEVIGATQLTEGELIVEAGGRAENTVVTGAGWLKVATGGSSMINLSRGWCRLWLVLCWLKLPNPM